MSTTNCIGPTFTTAELAVLRRSLADHKELLLLAELLAIAGAETRLQILYLLSEVKEMCVCDIASVLDMHVSAVSHQLRKLKDKHLIGSRRDTRTIYYSLQASKFNDYLQSLFRINVSEHVKSRVSVLAMKRT